MNPVLVRPSTKPHTSTENSVKPYGKPIISLDSIQSLDNGVRFRWRVDSNGSGLTTEDPGLSGSNGDKTLSASPAESKTLNVRYTNAAGTSTASWTGKANDPPPRRAWLSNPSGKSVTLNLQSYPSDTRVVRCWAARTYEERDWKDAGYNFGGEVGTMSIPANGTLRINCPDPRGVITSGKPLSIELQGREWIGPVTVP